MPKSTAPKGRQAGLSLVEMIVTAAVAAITMTLAVPSFESMRERRLLEGHADQLLHDLQYARSEAVSLNRSVRVALTQTAAGSCYVLYRGGAGDCGCAADGSAECVDADQALKTVLIPRRDGVRLQSSSAALLFHPLRGTTTPTATFRLDGRDGTSVQHVVNIMGRIRSCTPQGSLSGYRSC